jgi:hypothetical protein
MSKISDLKSKYPAYNLTLIDFLMNMFEKSKYVDLFLTAHKEKYVGRVEKEFEFDNWFFENGLDSVLRIDDYDHYQKYILYRLISGVFDNEELKLVNRFKELNEKNLIDQNDVSKYKDFSNIADQVSLAEFRSIGKSLEKQIIRIHEDDTWLMVKPLTWEASKKYGSNTKWCTTSQSEPSYFQRYAGDGVLIYIINKETGLKVAFHYCNEEGMSFWNQIDKRIDSLMTKLPDEIKFIIVDHLEKENMKSNLSYLTDEEREKYNKLYNAEQQRIRFVDEPMDVAELAPPPADIRIDGRVVRMDVARHEEEILNTVIENDTMSLTDYISAQSVNGINFTDGTTTLDMLEQL